MTTSTNTALLAISTAFHTLISEYALDLINSGSGILSTSLTNLKANPTISNVVAQGLAISVSAPLALPNLESQAISQFATVGESLLSALKAQASTAVS